MSKQPGHPSEAWPETWRLHAELPPQAAALLTGAALDLPHGKKRVLMRELAELLTAERVWLRLYAEGGKVMADIDEAAAGGRVDKVERFEELWEACKAEAEAALGAFLPAKAGR